MAEKTTLNILQRMAKASAEIQSVGKNLFVETGQGKGYQAVGETDIVLAVKPIEEKHGIYSYPVNREIIDSDVIEKQSKYGVQPVDSEKIAHLAGGDFIKALEAIQLNEENELFFNWFVSLMRLSYQRKIREMKQWSEQLASIGRERQKSFLDYCQRMIRENFIYNFHRPDMNYMTLQEENFSTRFAPFVNERNVMGIVHELTEAQIHIEQNVNPRMVFFDFALKMIVLLKTG